MFANEISLNQCIHFDAELFDAQPTTLRLIVARIKVMELHRTVEENQKTDFFQGMWNQSPRS